MKFEQSNAVKVEKSGNFQSATATIEMNEHMANVLSSTIYDDPILAIVREVGCNGLDEGFTEFTLPSMEDPTFIVRDYGRGLSQEDMTAIYLSYGASDKRNNSFVTGGLGLGCKSPFSYVAAFNVTSYFNGMAYHYAIYRNEVGIPAMDLLAVNSTSEKNGLKVQVPVKVSDIQKFHNAFRRASIFWDNYSVTNKNYEPNTLNIIAEGTFWKFYQISVYRTPDEGVRMGGVLYPINNDKFSVLNFHGSNKLMFNLPIGEVKFTASREQLQYDAAGITLQKLDAYRTAFYNEVRDQVQAYVDKASTIIEATNSIPTGLKSIVNALKQDHRIFTKDGKEFDILDSTTEITTHISRVFKDAGDTKVHSVLPSLSRLERVSYGRVATNSAYRAETDTFINKGWKEAGETNTYKASVKKATLKFTNRFVIVGENDTLSSVFYKMQQFYRKNSEKVDFYVFRKDKKADYAKYRKQTFNWINNNLNGVVILDFNDEVTYPTKPVIAGNRSVRTTKKTSKEVFMVKQYSTVNSYLNYSSYDFARHTFNQEVLRSDGGYWLPSNGNNKTPVPNAWKLQFISDHSPIKNKSVFIIQANQVSAAEKLDNWTLLTTAIDQEFAKVSVNEIIKKVSDAYKKYKLSYKTQVFLRNDSIFDILDIKKPSAIEFVNTDMYYSFDFDQLQSEGLITEQERQNIINKLNNQVALVEKKWYDVASFYDRNNGDPFAIDLLKSYLKEKEN